MDLAEVREQIDDVLNGRLDEIVCDDGHSGLLQEMLNVMFDFPEKPDGFEMKVGKSSTYKNVVLVSGGMDSTIMWELLSDVDKADKIALNVDVGQEYFDKEQEALRKSDIDFFTLLYPLTAPEGWNHIIPARNFVLLSLAEEYVSHEGKIWLGAVQGESSPDKGDKSELFFRLFEQYIWRTKRKAITIQTLKEKTKNDWLKWYIDKTGNTSIVTDTVTCFSGESDGHCGTCQACVRKWISLKYCGIDTANIFDKDPYEDGWEYIEKYKKSMTEALETGNFEHYSKDRCEQDLKVIHDYESSIRS